MFFLLITQNLARAGELSPWRGLWQCSGTFWYEHEPLECSTESPLGISESGEGDFDVSGYIKCPHNVDGFIGLQAIRKGHSLIQKGTGNKIGTYSDSEIHYIVGGDGGPFEHYSLKRTSETDFVISMKYNDSSQITLLMDCSPNQSR